MNTWQKASIRYERLIQNENKEFGQVAMTRLLAEAMWNNPQDLKFIRDSHWLVAARKPLGVKDRNRVEELYEDIVVRMNEQYPDDFDVIMGMDVECLFNFFGIPMSEYELAQSVLEDTQQKEQLGVMACVVTDVILEEARTTHRIKRLK